MALKRSHPCSPAHPDIKMSIPVVQRIEWMKNLAKEKTVLHLGCTNFPYTRESIEKEMLFHFALRDSAKELYGFDFDQEGIDILAGYGCGNLFRADLERLEDVELDRKFDMIIAGEMIEHLNNPGKFLEGIQRFMNSDSRLIITTVNAYCAMRFVIYALLGKGGTNEPVHPDHVAYYSYSTLKVLIERHGLTVDEFLFYDLGKEHRPHNRRLFNFVNDVAVRFSPQLADGLIAVCKLAGN